MLPFEFRYDYKTGVEVGVRKGSQSLSAPLGTLPMHVRGGYVIPTQDPASNTVASRRNQFGLIIALNDTMQARGSLYWDDGDSIDPLGSWQYVRLFFLVANVSLLRKFITILAIGVQFNASLGLHIDLLFF